MLETKEFKFVRNILWPFKSTLKISDEGFENKGTLVRWNDITKFNYGIQSINGAMTYIFNFHDKQGKRKNITFTVALTGKKAKKAMMHEIYMRMDQGFNEKLIIPQANQIIKDLNEGKSTELAGCQLSQKGLEVKAGLIKKKAVFIPWEKAALNHPDGAGGFFVHSVDDPKTGALLLYLNKNGLRQLEHVIREIGAARFGK